MEKKSTVSLCMIVKNEERYLKRCLSSVKDIVDEMIIVDTGSTDKTIDIAKEFDAKIIYYKWKDDFADARNVSLSYAKMDWILIMDGDDIFDSKDYENFKNIIEDNDEKYDIYFFNTASFAGTEEGEVINNVNVRLIRNNKGYRFKGAIHEQITDENGTPNCSKIKYLDIKIFHYGYLNEVTIEKNKRNRNISILERELEKEPDNIFNIANLATEYYCLGDYKKSLELYNSAYKNLKPELGYSSKVVMRRITNLVALGKNKEALKAIEEGLIIYPAFTDLIYVRAEIYEREGKYTLAIRSLMECIKKGESPLNLNFLSGSGTFKACELLGNIYKNLKDYDKALESYEEAYKFNGNKKKYSKVIIKTLIEKKKEDKGVNIAKYFEENINENQNEILSILLDYGYLEDYDEIIKASGDRLEKNNNSLLLKGRRLFYDKKYYEALGYFSYLEGKKYNISEVIKYKTIILLIISPEVIVDYIEQIEVDDNEREVLLSLYKLLNKLEINDFDSKYDLRKILDLSVRILREILLIKEFDLFEKLLGVLNYISNDGVLIELAKLYDDLGFEKMASQEVIRSIKMFNTIDYNCIDILKRGL